jgi:peptide/nickel transport system substrate-binding protein
MTGLYTGIAKRVRKSTFRSRLSGAAAAIVIAAAAGLPASAAELTIGHSSLPKGLGNPLTDTSHSAGFTFMLAYDFLTYGSQQGPRAGLALAWENTGPLTWRLRLRPEVQFHNGKIFDAHDIADLINWMNTEEGLAKAVNTMRNMRNINGARVIDPLTVEVTTKTPDPMVPALLGVMKVVNMTHMVDVGWDGYGRDPVGTGAYKPVKWTFDGVELEAHKSGWRPGLIDTVVVRNLPELASRVAAFQSDQIDIALGIVADSAAAVEGSNGRMVVSGAPQVLLLMAFQNKDSPVHDVRVRRALNYAVNKEAYISAIMGGLTVPTGQPGASSVNGYQADIKPYPYDPARARSLLRAAGYPDGLDLIAEVVANVSELRDVYQQVSADAAKVGINIEVREITLPDLIARVRDTSKFGETTLFSFNMGSEPTMDIMRSINALHSCKSFTKWICYEEIEDEIDAANTEFDAEKRRGHLRNIAQFYHDNPPGIFLHEEVGVDGVKNTVKNYNPVNRVINWHQVTISN